MKLVQLCTYAVRKAMNGSPREETNDNSPRAKKCVPGCAPPSKEGGGGTGGAKYILKAKNGQLSNLSPSQLYSFVNFELFRLEH